jgi:hypothetical protein
MNAEAGAVRKHRVEGVPPSNRGLDARDTRGGSRTDPTIFFYEDDNFVKVVCSICAVARYF